MPSNYTPNYSLNQWEADDRVLRTDFNADNAKIDAAIKAVDALARSKADTSALNALTQVVSGKGNCRIAAGTYTGSGTFGADAPNRLTFPFQPLAVLISSGMNTAVLVAGTETVIQPLGMLSLQFRLTWSGKSLAWYVASSSYFDGSSYNKNAATQLNEEGTVYHYLAIGTA